MKSTHTPSWRWSSTSETQRRLLDAATEVFTAEGYLNASVSDIVAKADSSTGSLYHHFGGKAELFIALWESHNTAHLHQVRESVAAARLAGVTDPLDLFCAGARGYWAGSWERREIALMFLDADGPPGFEKLRRQTHTEWIRLNSNLLGPSSDSARRMSVGVLTGIITEAAREVITCKTKQQVSKIADIACDMIRRVSLD